MRPPPPKPLFASRRQRGGVAPTSVAVLLSSWPIMPAHEEFVARSVTTPSFELLTLNPSVDTMISASVTRTGLWQPSITRVVQALASRHCNQTDGGALAVDVGTNIGYETLMLLMHGCRVIGFEMQDEISALVQQSAARNGVASRLRMLKRAVTDHDDDVLHRSVVTRGNFGGVGLLRTPWRPPPKSESGRGPASGHGGGGSGSAVQTTTLDRELRHAGEITLMKMDIQGSEPAALRGATNLLRRGRVRNLILELDPQSFGGVTPAVSLLRNLSSFGFHYVTELPYLQSTLDEFRRPLAAPSVCPLVAGPHDKPGWEATFGEAVAARRDRRGVGFTDLWLSLEPQPITRAARAGAGTRWCTSV